MPDDLTTVTESSAHASLSLTPGTTKSIETDPTIDSAIWGATMLNNGSAAVLWSEYGTRNLYISVVQQGGTITKVPISLSDNITGMQGHLAAVGADRFVAVFDDEDDLGGVGSFSAPFLRIFDSAGNAITADIALPSAGQSTRYFDAVGLKDGSFVVTWLNDSDHKLYFSHYTQGGTPVAGQNAVPLPNVNSNVTKAAVAGDASGGFMYAVGTGDATQGLKLYYMASNGAVTPITGSTSGEQGSLTFDGTNFWCFYRDRTTTQVYASKITGGSLGAAIAINSLTSASTPHGAVLSNGNLLVWDNVDTSGKVGHVVETSSTGALVASYNVAADHYVMLAATPDPGALVFDNFATAAGPYDITLTPLDTTFLIPNTPPVVSAPPTISFTDTAAADTFVAATGTVSATDDHGVTAYGITGGSAGSTTINSITYNVSKAGTYGTLYLRSSDGAYLYQPNAAAINALSAGTSENFTVTATDASNASGSATLTISLTGTNDKPVITGMTSGGQFTAGAADPIADNAYLPTEFNGVSDVDSPNFAGGYLLITQTSGTTDGHFVGDVSSGVKAGADVASADGVFSAGDKVYVDLSQWGGHGTPGFVQVGTVSSTTGGALRIDFTASTTPDYVTWLLKWLAYTAPTVGARGFTLVLNDGGVSSNPLSFSMTGIDNDPPVLASIVRTTPAAALTNADSLVFRITFSEAVTGVDGTDFTVLGTTAQVTGVTAAGGNAYDVTVSGGDLAGLNGTVTLQVSGTNNIKDTAGNALASTTPSGTNNNTYTLDNSVAAPQFALTADTGASASDGITRNGAVNVTLATDVASWQYSIDGGAHWTTGSGTSFTLAAGSYAAGAVQVRQTDLAGNTSTAAANAAAIVVDTAAAAPSFGLAVDSGVSSADGTSTDGTVSVTLAADAASWGYSTDGGAHWAPGTGTSFVLAEGSYAAGAVQVRQTDVAGNTSTAAANTGSLTIDHTVAAPTLTLPADVGASTSDGITAQAAVNVTLDGDVAGWEYSLDAGATWHAGSGTSFTLADGSYAAGQVQVRQTDRAGNVSAAASCTSALTVDTAVAAPALSLAVDTGASATDGITMNPAVNVSLAADAAAWEYSTDGGATWHAGSGTSFSLAAGTYATGAVQVRQTDVAGNLSAAASNPAALVVDNAAAAPGLALAADTGSSASDGITRNPGVNVTLAVDVATWEYSLDAGATWHAGSGASFTLAAGTYAVGAVQVRQTDLAGNVSSTATNGAAITIDTNVPAPALALATDTGASASDGITSNGAVNVTLAGDAASWEYSIDAGVHWATGSGTSFTLAPGSYAAGQVQVRQTDVAGNVSTAASNPAALAIDTAAAAPSLALAADTGASATDGITNSPAVNVSLAADVASWEYSLDAGATWHAGSGTSFTLAAGSYAAGAVQVRQTDAAGNLSSAGTNAAQITIDTSVPAPSLALAADTGASASDGITSNPAVNVTLAGDAASWQYSADGGAHWTTGSGTSFTLADGSYAAGQVQVRQTDIAGNLSAAGSNAIALTIGTAAAVPGLALAADTGASATDGITNSPTVNVTLAADVVAWEYSVDAGLTWHTGSGASFDLAVGSYAAGAVQVRQTDIAGNLSAISSNTTPITIDTSVAAPSLALAADTGASDGITANPTVHVTLAGDVASWQYSIDGGAHWTPGSGTSFTLADGSYATGAIQVRQTDLAGNQSAAAANASAITVDRTAGAPALALAADTGASATDGITSNASVNVALAADAAAWEYSLDAGLTWHTGSGTSFSLAAGTYAAGAVQVRQTDVAGNLSAPVSNAAPITVDTSVAAPALAIAADTGVSAGDGITSNATVNVTLASDAASWQYSLDAGAHWTAGSGTSFTLADGSYGSGQVQVCQTDLAGNQSAPASLAAAVVVDTHAPTASAIDRAALRQPAGSASFTIAVHYTDGGAGVDAATLGKDDITVTGPGSVGALVVQGVQYDAATGIATYTVAAPGAGWSAAAHAGTYVIGLAANQVRDVAGNALAANASAASFEVSFNASPIIGSNGGGATGTVELAENTAAVTTVSATDDDHETVAYSISGGADAALFAIDAATGALTFRSAPHFAAPADADHDNSYLVEVTASDGNGGTDVQALTVKVLSDLDGDGTPDANDSDIDNDGRPNSIEDAVRSPFGGNGDGNGDGVADSRQLNVASLPTVVSGAPYVTLAVGAGLSLTGVAATAAPGTLPRSAKMPFGQFDFTIGQLVPGATTEVSIYVDATPQVNGYFKQNASGAWVNIAKSITTVGDKVKITFDLTDGGIYDSDHTVNGSITDPGGAVLVTPLIGSNGGATTALVDVDENQEAVTTIHADALGHVTYSISGGADAGRFTIDANTGALRFTNAPNYENPQDQGDTVHNNTYVVQVSASDQYGSDIQLLTVRVNDVDETPRGNTEYVDGTPVQTGTVTNPDGTTSHTITVPVVVPGRVDQVGGNNVADIPLVTNGAGAPVLSVQVPTGLGLQVSGTPAPQPAGNSLTDLIREIKAHTVAGSSDQATMTDGGSGFLSSLPTDTPLLVHSIVPTAPAAGAPGTPLVISGVPHAAGTPDTALVIDTRGLPSGVAIELQDVSFAAVAGSAHVTSGAGSQTIWGDGANQSIVLGAGDDVVHAGGGDDLVVSGVGNNYIDGGSGNDTVGLAGASRADYNLRIHDGKLVMTALNGGGGTDVVANVENLRFAGGADVSFGATDVGALVRMYDTLFGRRPDEGGINFWLNASEHAHSMHEIAAGFVNSNEAQQRYGSFSNAQFVDMLYKVGMERQAGVQELAYWTERLDSGAVDRAGLLVEFAQSAEKVALVGVITTSVETL